MNGFLAADNQRKVILYRMPMFFIFDMTIVIYTCYIVYVLACYPEMYMCTQHF